MNSKSLVLDFFLRNALRPLPDDCGPLTLACLYLDERILDSLGIVSLVTEIESACGIEFSAEDMQSHEFQTIGGFITLLDRKLATRP